MRQALRINSDLEIYFSDDGRALFQSRSGKQLAAVQEELSKWQEFVERWQQMVEEPKQIRLTPEGKVLKANIESFVKFLRKAGVPGNVIEELITSVTPKLIEHNKNLTTEQIEGIVGGLIATL
jgi:hypothetical protein